ncbi:MAG: cysteine--tRNA ligase [bacterium]|nr:cysteine--tRNA ligase [bacterium]MDE0287525.1 cysteine--tRNA ligase [bacterium]MDE0437748.1 cysteine--tRNA ligase [bacterium]
MITVYNTLGREPQAFKPLEEGLVRMYVCGPTVQSAPHLGHGRCAVVFDVIRRYLVWRGWDVRYVQNITDVDDKIIANASRLQIAPEELARDMAGRFRSGYRALNVLDPDVEPAATEHIPGMIAMIGRLVDRGLAYPGGGDVYFRVRALEGYGRLSGRNIDELRSGERIEPGVDKEDPLDFALWKGAKPGEPAWPSPWGPGRPGWHIECSAMSAEYLGPSFDIHAGGSDLIFPHHENEIAQSEGASGLRFAKYWLHNGMVNLGGEKLSKSTGHTIDLAEAIERHGGAVIRLFYLRAAYRSPLEFSEELLEEAATSLERLRAFARRSPQASVADTCTIERFAAAMDDDFNTAEALAVLFETVRDGNARLDRGRDAGAQGAAVAELAGVLGIDLADAGLDDLAGPLADLAVAHGVGPGSPDVVVEALIAARTRARSARDWERADAIRHDLAGIGILIEDSADGSRWHRR